MPLIEARPAGVRIVERWSSWICILGAERVDVRPHEREIDWDLGLCSHDAQVKHLEGGSTSGAVEPIR